MKHNFFRKEKNGKLCLELSFLETIEIIIENISFDYFLVFAYVEIIQSSNYLL